MPGLHRRGRCCSVRYARQIASERASILARLLDGSRARTLHRRDAIDRSGLSSFKEIAVVDHHRASSRVGRAHERQHDQRQQSHHTTMHHLHYR